MKLTIDNDIPVPTDLSWQEKLEKLKVGQSMPVLSGSEETVRQTAWRHFHKGKKPGHKQFVTLQDPTDSENYRVWRVK